MESKRVIDLRGVSIYLGQERRSTANESDLILSNINLQVDEGELVYLIGRVGTGKSTLLKMMYAEVEMASG